MSVLIVSHVLLNYKKKILILPGKGFFRIQFPIEIRYNFIEGKMIICLYTIYLIY